MGEIVLGIGCFLAAFIGMEVAAWAAHKYVMHGFMWYFHRDHHQSRYHFFQKNDVFFVIFAIPSWLGIMLGLMYQRYGFVWAGFGIMAYGITYFLVHDVLIHQRFKWFRNTQSAYLLALRKAHRAHHVHLEKEDGECFGMLLVPYKYYKESKATRNQPKSTK